VFVADGGGKLLYTAPSNAQDQGFIAEVQQAEHGSLVPIVRSGVSLADIATERRL